MSSYWISLFLIGGIGASLAYFLARRIQVMALVDVVWTAGLGLSALAYRIAQPETTLRSTVVLCVILIWSIRLSAHLLKHRVFVGIEDPRYAYLTAHWGKHAMRNYYPLFLAQVLLIALFMLPISTAMQPSESSWGGTDWLALMIAGTALIGQQIADRQLTAFRKHPGNTGKVCQLGLWRYSRHPNYFFEWLHWWAYVAFAVNSPTWPFALLGPLCMYLFLRYITGVPYAERSSLRSRGDAYQSYQRTTNTFFPWKPHLPAQH